MEAVDRGHAVSGRARWGVVHWAMDVLLTALAPVELILIALGVVLASLMRAFTGFGFALLAVPLFSFFLIPGDAVVTAALLTLAVSLVTYKAWWRQVPIGTFLPMILGSILGTAVGVLFLARFSPEQFQLWIGLTVVAVCLLLARFQPRSTMATPALSTGAGLLSGLMNGAFAIPGPPAIIYAMACIPEPAGSRAFLMAFFMASAAISLTMFAGAGLVTQTPFYLMVGVMPAMLVGDRIGTWLFARLGGRAYRPIALVISLAAGIALSARALYALQVTV